jgi:hypothetical protein
VAKDYDEPKRRPENGPSGRPIFDSRKFHLEKGIGRRITVSFRLSVFIAVISVLLIPVVVLIDDTTVRTFIVLTLFVFAFLLWMLRDHRGRLRLYRESLARLVIHHQGILMSECLTDSEDKWRKFFPFENIERIVFVRFSDRGKAVGFDLVMRANHEDCSIIREKSDMKALVKILYDLHPELCEFKTV